jgi:hypothetical protein
MERSGDGSFVLLLITATDYNALLELEPMIQSAVARMRTSLYRPNEPPTRQENWKVGVSHYQWYGHCQGSALTVSVPVRHCSHFCERARVVPMMEGRITRPMVKFLRLLSGFLASWHVLARRGHTGHRGQSQWRLAITLFASHKVKLPQGE